MQSELDLIFGLVKAYGFWCLPMLMFAVTFDNYHV
jgi:hypothetical protein